PGNCEKHIVPIGEFSGMHVPIEQVPEFTHSLKVPGLHVVPSLTGIGMHVPPWQVPVAHCGSTPSLHEPPSLIAMNLQPAIGSQGRVDHSVLKKSQGVAEPTHLPL